MIRNADTQALTDELITAIRAALPGYEADGLVMVVQFQARRLRRERIRLSTAFTPTNVGYSAVVWSRPRRGIPPGSHPIPRATVRRLDRIVAELDRRRAFHYDNRADWWEWMDEEPLAFPGLGRLVITIIPTPPPSSGWTNPYEPTPAQLAELDKGW